MDTWTLAYLAGHRDMSITRRDVHPQAEIGHSAEHAEAPANNNFALIS
jgi:hypothetical protein